MKKICTLFFVLYAFAIAGAQGLTVTPSDSVSIITSDTTQSDSSLYSTLNAAIFIHNNLSDSIVVKWGLSSTDTVASWGWTLLFCDNNNCYQLPTAPKTSSAVGPGDSIDMHAEFTPDCSSGTGTFHISAKVVLSSNDSTIASLSLAYTAVVTATCATGINNINSEPVITVYPNPATNQISVNGLTYGHPFSVQLIDLQGQVINTENKLADEMMAVNIASLPAGLYLLKLIDLQTNQTVVKKLTKF